MILEVLLILEDRAKRLSDWVMFLPEKIMRKKVVSSKVAVNTAVDSNLSTIWRYIQVKEDNWVFTKWQIHVRIFPHCDFQCLIQQTIKKYSFLVKLNQHIKQLRTDRNSKEINLAKFSSRIIVTEHVSWYLKGHTPYSQMVDTWEKTGA